MLVSPSPNVQSSNDSASQQSRNPSGSSRPGAALSDTGSISSSGSFQSAASYSDHSMHSIQSQQSHHSMQSVHSQQSSQQSLNVTRFTPSSHTCSGMLTLLYVLLKISIQFSIINLNKGHSCVHASHQQNFKNSPQPYQQQSSPSSNLPLRNTVQYSR